MEKFNIMLADHVVGIESRFPENRDFFSDYLTDSGKIPEITAAVDDSEIEGIVAANPEISRKNAELTALYRPIAEAMPMFGGMVFHGAAISFGGKGYIFTAPSGTGKSTHIRLWRKYFGKSVDIVNGDKPIITVDDRGILVHGTPWAGKERWQKNRCVPLGGICLLKRGECHAEKISSNDALPLVFRQTYLSSHEETVEKTMELLDCVMSNIPIVSLHCDISEDAVKCSFEALCGEVYEDHKI